MTARANPGSRDRRRKPEPDFESSDGSSFAQDVLYEHLLTEYRRRQAKLASGSDTTPPKHDERRTITYPPILEDL